MRRRTSTSRFRTRYAETDQMGVVHHGSYVVWCEVGRTDFIRELGTTYADIERMGVYLAVADLRIRYGAAAHYDDLVEVESWLEDVRSRTVRFGYRIHRLEPEPAELATATSTLISLDADGRTRRIPPEVMDLFSEAG